MIIKFLVDFMLGKLARELRVLGFDTVYVQSVIFQNKNPVTLLNLAKEQDRVILTRNIKLKDYSEVFFITSEKINDQVNQVVRQFKLIKEIKPFIRCIICNEVLVSITKDEVKNKVPFYIFQTQNKFVHCPKCKRIYWAGSHLEDMQKRTRKFD
jgi:hypothetical protein